MSLSIPPGGWPEHLTQPVHFANSQWAVTDYGLECLDRVRYAAAGHRMAEKQDGTDLYDWPVHMAEKDWVDLNSYLPAFRDALLRFRPEAFDEDCFTRSVGKAWTIRRGEY